MLLGLYYLQYLFLSFFMFFNLSSTIQVLPGGEPRPAVLVDCAVGHESAALRQSDHLLERQEVPQTEVGVGSDCILRFR